MQPEDKFLLKRTRRHLFKECGFGIGKAALASLLDLRRLHFAREVEIARDVGREIGCAALNPRTICRSAPARKPLRLPEVSTTARTLASPSTLSISWSNASINAHENTFIVRSGMSMTAKTSTLPKAKWKDSREPPMPATTYRS